MDNTPNYGGRWLYFDFFAKVTNPNIIKVSAILTHIAHPPNLSDCVADYKPKIDVQLRRLTEFTSPTLQECQTRGDVSHSGLGGGVGHKVEASITYKIREYASIWEEL